MNYGMTSHPISLEGGRYANLQLPNDLTMHEAMKLGRIIEALAQPISTITPALDAAIQDEIEHGPASIIGSEK